MAYDLRRIAPEKEIPPFKPAWKRCTALFVLIAGGGAFGVISLWPAIESTRTSWFWICVVVFPFLAWLVPCLFYLGILQSRRLRAIEYNEDRNDYIRNVQQKAGVPLHVVGSGFVFSAQEQENTPLAVTEKELKLESRSRYPGDDRTVTARWIEPPGDAWRPGDENADSIRQQEVFRYVLHSLVAQMAPAMRALPERVRVVATLSVNIPFEATDISTVWCEAWRTHGLEFVRAPIIRATPPELIEVDKWLDGDAAFPPNAVTVLCVIHLNALLNDSPETRAAEAGAMLLLAPAPFATRKRLTRQALLYRPEQGAEPDLSQNLLQALLWSRTAGSVLADHWFTGGAETPLQRALSEHLDAQGVALAKAADLQGHHDIDLRIGNAGTAGAWLNVALAATFASQCGRTQLISVTQKDALTLAVIVPCP